MDENLLRVNVHKDEVGWYAVTDWEGDPIVFRLPDGYDPREDRAHLVLSMLTDILNGRVNAD